MSEAIEALRSELGFEVTRDGVIYDDGTDDDATPRDRAMWSALLRERERTATLVEAGQAAMDWIVENTIPNESYRYSRCKICGVAWWDDKERHNHDCFVPSFQVALLEGKEKRDD